MEGTYLKRALEISGEAFFVHRKGDNYVSRNKIHEALNVFETTDLNTDAYANLRLSSLLILNKKFDQAEKYVAQAVVLDPIDYDARLFQGTLRLVKGQYELAVNSFRLAADERPTSSIVQSNLAVAYMGLNLHDKVLAALRRAVALNPLNTNAVMMLADVTYLSGQNEDSVPSLRYYVQFEQKNAAL